MKSKVAVLLIVILSLSQLGWTSSPQQTRPLRVCAYENAPKIYTDETGTIAGFWPDLLGAIAQQEGWTLNWVHGSWDDCMVWLEQNQVDIVPDVGWTETRSQTYVFSTEPVLTSWARLYGPVGSQINSILDLEGKTIAGLTGSLNLDGPEGIKELIGKFDLHATFVEMDTYTQVFEALDQGTVDAGVTNKDFGNLNEGKYRVVRTPILLQPTRIRFAFAQDAALTPYLIERIDAHMNTFKADQNSVYYQALDTYLGTKASSIAEQVIPDWVRTLAVWAGGIFLFLVAVGVVSRVQVQRRTAQLRESQALFQAVIDATSDAIFVKDAQGRYILANAGVALAARRPGADVSGQDDHALFPDDAESIIANDQRIIAGGKVITYEETLPGAGGKVHTFLTTKGPLFDQSGKQFGLFGIARDITDRKLAEETLRSQQQLIAAIAETSPAMIYVYDMETQSNVYINMGVERMLNYSAQEVQALGAHLLPTLIHPEDMAAVIALQAKIMAAADTDTLELEYRMQHQNGEWRTFHSYERPFVRNTDGSLKQKIGAAIDISERKQAETEVRQRAEELAALNALGREVSLSLSLDEVISAALQGMWKAVDPDLAYFFLRDGERLLLKGVVPAAAKVRLGDVPEHRVGECLCGLAASEKTPIYCRDIFKDLRSTWEECKKAGVRSFAALPLLSGGEVIGVIGLASNQERDFEAQASFLETLSTTIAVSLGNALLHEQTQKRLDDLATIHRAAQQLQVIQPPHALSQTLIHLLETEMGYDYGAILLVDAESDALFPFALSHQGRDLDFVEQDKAYVRSKGVRVGKGITGWVAQSGESVRLGDVRQDARYTSMRSDIRSELCVPLRAGDQIIGVVNTETTAMDAYSAADQRMLETIAAQIAVAIQNARLLEQIQRYAAELEQRVNERTAQLQFANKDLESFSYSVSHDLRAPLRAISGFSEIIARRHRADLNHEGQHYVDNIVQASARMGQLIDDLLTYSRLGRAGIRHQPISLAVLMQEISTNLGSLVSASHGTLNLAQGLPTVMGDQTLLSQIFTNLLENGLKYHQPDMAPQVSVDFHVGTAEEVTIRPPAPLAPQPWGEQSTTSPRIGGRGAEDLPEDPYVIVSVTDNGIGIPAEYQDKIFNIFQRLHSEEEYPGTGIGLATVRKAVDLLGGKVWMASQVGQGSTFWVKLPKG